MNQIHKLLVFLKCRAACFMHAFGGTILLGLVIGNLLGDSLVDNYDCFIALVAYSLALLYIWYTGVDPYDGKLGETPSAILSTVFGIALIVAGLYGHVLNGLPLYYVGLGCLAVGLYTWLGAGPRRQDNAV